MKGLRPGESAAARYRNEEKRFSVCTLVTDWEQYSSMVATFQSRGFIGPDTEFLYLDNSVGNYFDGYSGLNLFLNTARGRHIILCHQDVRLLDDGIAILQAKIAELEGLDPQWAVVGNAGGIKLGKLALRISDPHGKDTRQGHFPIRVSALDENFLVVRRSANLALSRDLTGFHLYGTDLCLLADVLGHGCYVIDFHLRHLSAGKADHRFHEARHNLIAKYCRAFRARWLVSPSTSLFVSACRVLSAVMNSRCSRKIARQWIHIRNR
jgi:hypothetical protein